MVKYEEMTWIDIQKKLASTLLIIPVGSIEQHSSHLPVSVDSIIAENLAFTLAEKIGAIVAPTMKYGSKSLTNSGGGSSFPGTIGISGITLITFYTEAIKEYLRAGAKRILILNGHFENEAFIVEAIEQVKKHMDKECMIVELSWWNVINKDEMKEIFGKFDCWDVEHAAQAETALMMYYRPDLVGEFNDNVKPLNMNPSIYSTKCNKNIIDNLGSLYPYSHVTLQMATQFVKKINIKLIEMIDEVGIYE